VHPAPSISDPGAARVVADVARPRADRCSAGSDRSMHGAMRLRLALLVPVLLLLLGAVHAPAASAATPSIAVRGGHLVDGDGRTVQLRGVNRSGTEYACAKETDGTTTRRGYAIFDGPDYDSGEDSKVQNQERTLTAMEAWGINAVRVPISDACWFGEKNSALNTSYSGEAYRRAILGYVDRLAQHGMVAILSLHVASTSPASNLGPQSGGSPVLLPMPERSQGRELWTDVVQKLASTRARNVVYDLFNEPHLEDAVFTKTDERAEPWRCWRDGGCTLIDPTAARATPPATYVSAGMQELVTAVRTKERDTGFGDTPRPIMLGGLDYANDLSGWTDHLPTDPKDALVASFHVYGGRTRCADEECWDRTIAPIRQGAEPRPVVTGEVGQYDCGSDFVSRYTAWADRQAGGGASYLAWTWNATLKGTPAVPGASGGWACDGGPSLLKFNDGTPTDAYGLAYCQHLQLRRAQEGGTAVPQTTGPCPASRPLSSPPADATPVTGPPTGPGTPGTPTAPVTPTAPGAPTDPGPFSPATPVVPATPATPTAPAVPPRSSTPGEPRTARVTSRSLKVRRGRVTIAVSCARGATPCRGRVKVRTARKVALGRRRATVLVLVSVAYDVRAGRTATLVAKPTADGRALLRRSRKVRTVATATSDGGLPLTRRLTLAR